MGCVPRTKKTFCVYCTLDRAAQYNNTEVAPSSMHLFQMSCYSYTESYLHRAQAQPHIQFGTTQAGKITASLEYFNNTIQHLYTFLECPVARVHSKVDCPSSCTWQKETTNTTTCLRQPRPMYWLPQGLLATYTCMPHCIAS